MGLMSKPLLPFGITYVEIYGILGVIIAVSVIGSINSDQEEKTQPDSTNCD